MKKLKTTRSKSVNRPWYTQHESEKLNKGINIRLREDEFKELKMLCDKDEQSMTSTGRVLLRKHLIKLRKKHKVEE